MLAAARLYRGCGPPLVTAGVYTSAAFGIYDNIRTYLEQKKLRRTPCPCAALDPFHLKCVFLAGAASSGLLALPTCPLANLQVLQQASPQEKKASALGWTRRLLAQRGLRSFYRGFFPHFVQGSIGRGIYMSGYELVKGLEDTFLCEGLSATLAGKILAASSAGVGGWIFTYPFDVVRSNLIADWQRIRHASTFGTLLNLYREGGVRRLYAGLWWTLFRAVPVAAVTLPTYEFAHQAILDYFAEPHEIQNERRHPKAAEHGGRTLNLSAHQELIGGRGIHPYPPLPPT